MTEENIDRVEELKIEKEKNNISSIENKVISHSS